jgi:hypothetical protein
MSEFLLRGWNVAVPVVDIGDDVFVIDDRDKTTYRLQVKSSRVVDGKASFSVSRTQLREPKPIELFYMLLAREGQCWRFFVIPRDGLFRLHERYLATPREGRPGRPPVSNEEARSDNLTFDVNLDTPPTLWGNDIHDYEGWPSQLPEIPDGPGSVTSST